MGWPRTRRGQNPVPSKINGILDNITITFVDLGPEGANSGDQRVVKRTLTDQDGNTVGSMHVVATLLTEAAMKGHDLLLGNVIHQLPNGTIDTIGLAPIPAVADQSRGLEKPILHVVSGGTGAFAHATGERTATTQEDGTLEISFELRCDEPVIKSVGGSPALHRQES